MRRLVLVTLSVAFLLACTASLTEGHCTSDGDDGLVRTTNPGPNCNGAAHAHECAAAGAPSAYGIEEGCKVPAMWVDGDALCRPRARGLIDCVPVGHLLCCPP